MIVQPYALPCTAIPGWARPGLAVPGNPNWPSLLVIDYLAEPETGEGI